MLLQTDVSQILQYSSLLTLVWVAFAFDVHQRRIPNALTLSAAVLGIVMQLLNGGTGGMMMAVSGLAVGFAILLPGYLMRATGAGDVKLMAAAGTFLGPSGVLLAGLVSIAAGALIAASLAAGSLLSASARTPWQRYGFMLRSLVTTGRFFYMPPKEGEVMGRRFPFALSIAIGTTITLVLWWPGLGVYG